MNRSYPQEENWIVYLNSKMPTANFIRHNYWWSRVESNHYLRLRRPSSYPLDHGTSELALKLQT